MGSTKPQSDTETEPIRLKRYNGHWESVDGIPVLCADITDEYLPESWRVDGKEIFMQMSPFYQDSPFPKQGGRLIILNEDTVLLSARGARKFEQDADAPDWSEVTVIGSFMRRLKLVRGAASIRISFEEVPQRKKRRLVDFEFSGTIRLEPGDYSDLSIATDIEASMNYAASRLTLRHPLAARAVRVRVMEVIERKKDAKKVFEKVQNPE